MSTRPFTLGSVAYDPKVVTIWDGFQQHFGAHGLPFDYVLYTSYERLVAAQFAGEVDVAWNSPLAWVQTERLAKHRGRALRTVAMRDTDRDLTTAILARADGPVRALEDLRGKRVAVGAKDSPQATILPLGHLAERGVAYVPVFHDVLVGKHGDHIGGERDAVRALMAGEVDAACILDANTLTFTREGTLRAGSTRVLAQVGPYDHCSFTVLDGVNEQHLVLFTEVLFAMKYDDERVRPLMDLEGLRAWMPGRTEGYALLRDAVDRLGSLDAWWSEVRA